MRIYISIMDKVNSVLKIVLVLLLSVAFLSLCLQVFSRFLFQVPITWTEELSRYLMIWIAFIGTSVAVRHKLLIRIEAINNLLSSKMNVVINWISSVIMLIFCAVVFYYGLDLLEVTRMQTSPALHIPMSIPYSSILFGCVLMFCNTIVNLFDPTQEGE